MTKPFTLSPKQYRWQDGFLLAVKLAPLQAVLLIFYAVLQTAVPVLNIAATAGFVNSAISIAAGESAWQKVLFPLAGLVFITAFQELGGAAIGYVRTSFRLHLRLRLRTALTDKRSRLEYRHLENQDTWNLTSRVCDKPEEKFSQVFQEGLQMISFLVSSVSVLMVIMVEIWWAGLLILAVTVPLLFLSQKSGQQNYQASRDASKIQRRYEYLNKILTDRDSASERALFGFSEKIREAYTKSYHEAFQILVRTMFKWFIRMKAGGVVSAFFCIFVILVLAPSAISGSISIGIFISLVNAVFNLSQNMSWQLSNIMEKFAHNQEYFKDLTQFSRLEEQEGAELYPSENPPPFQRLEFKNVTFRYPDTDHDIIKNLSFCLEAGKHYSFVGVNGAGKTTITKLMTGLYQNYEGNILLNGKELREYPFQDLKAIFCGVFQDFARYSVTLRENIELGHARELEKNGAGGTNCGLSVSCRLAGLENVIDKLSSGLDTPLGKIYEDGADLSGGEWQRTAMARAIQNPAEIKILDEPTAALDPLAENEVYENFQEISRGHTTVFISHRLGSTRLADVIYVLDGGSVSEMGTHEELMEKGGLYAEMFESQRSWYQV